MTIKIREWKRGSKVGFEVDIRFTYPDGSPFRRRYKAPVESKSAAKRWGDAREAELLRAPSPNVLRVLQAEKKEVLTVRDFGPRFVENDAKANRQKASSIRAKELILQNHIYPLLGDTKLDAVTDEKIQKLKVALSSLSPKTVNNVLTVQSKLLRMAVRWKEIATVPCVIELLRVLPPLPQFLDFPEYDRVVHAAPALGARYESVVLLGGDAGLRGGEMIALRWGDIDFKRQHIQVQRQMWRRIVDTPKSGRGRIIPMTDALTEALRRQRKGGNSDWVFATGEDRPPSYRTARLWFASVIAQAELSLRGGGVHILRHSFCSHLAMRGAPAKAIQELAGHIHISTTERYMHLSPAARDGAIGLLNARREAPIFGDIVETAH